MSGFETRFGTEVDAERIRTTFYGFVEQHAADVDGDAHIRTELHAEGPQLLVRLWSAEALSAFLQALNDAGPRGRPDA